MSPSIEGLLLHPHQSDRFRLPNLNLLWGGQAKNQTHGLNVYSMRTLLHATKYLKRARQECLTLNENTEDKREVAWAISEIHVDWLVPLGKGSFCNKEIAKMVTKFLKKRDMHWYLGAEYSPDEVLGHRWQVWAWNGQRRLGRPRCRWGDNSEMDVQEVGCGDMAWI
jgi:hypothetical protein